MIALRAFAPASALVATLGCASSFAVEAPWASASFTNVQITFTDLDPFDGILPSLTLGQVATLVSVGSPNMTNAMGDIHSFAHERRRSSTDGLSAVMPTVEGFLSSASAVRQPGLTGDIQVATYLPDINNLSSNSTLEFYFTIPSNTAVTLSGARKITGGVTEVGRDVADQDANAVASVGVFHSTLPLGSTGDSLVYSLNSRTSTVRSFSESLDFSITLTNSTPGSWASPAFASFTLSASNRNTVAIVPEPSTYAMMLAGALALAAVARAKRS
jgi:hypothetical protein